MAFLLYLEFLMFGLCLTNSFYHIVKAAIDCCQCGLNLAVLFFMYTLALLILPYCLLRASSTVSLYTCIIFCMSKFMDWIFFNFPSAVSYSLSILVEDLSSMSLGDCVSFSVSGFLIDRMLNDPCLLRLCRKGFMLA